MTKEKIQEAVGTIMTLFENYNPGQGLKMQALESLSEKKGLPRPQYNIGINLLLTNGYVEFPKDGRISNFVVITEKGYSFLKGEEKMVLALWLPNMVSVKQPKDRIFYMLWDLVGDGDDSTNPFYVTGPEFYNTIKEYITGLPPTYLEYLSDREKSEGRKPKRSIWCKDLFMQLPDGNILMFMEKLSELVNEKIDSQIDSNEDDNDNVNDVGTKITSMAKPKIFISHNEEDASFAHALVDMLVALGMKYEDIFCSSHPACSIPFGKSILNTMRKQFDEYKLTVLFIHSPRLYASAASLCEMGAAWILRSEIFSFLTNDCEFGMLKGVVTNGDAAFKAGQDNTYRVLNDFRRFLENEFHLATIPDSAWDYTKQKFIDTVANI